ncbi:hypothetical protein BJ138DRAFT_1141432 [Hygrophoropsis aurantiaca]|uniref:Uncharacterized protein n=1 Tax=Hygrophoropsis aurantiaca TaxID=72124 RepID=A0ACB8AQM3_9AGAM|nr:hypothetical protein BJ138DRAFT_1141432 [Hygrophoropsis aurantiaca]
MALNNAERFQLQTSKYVNIGAFAILAFDYLLTFQSETRWVWGRKWDITRIIFTFSRYLPFMGAGMTVYAGTHTSGHYRVGLEENIVHIVGIVAAEGLLVLRIYAFWQCSKKLLIGLLAYAMATLAAAASIDINPNYLVPGTTPTISSGFEASRNGALVYALLMTYEFVLLSLLIYKKWSYRETSNLIVNKVYQDGVLYIASIVFITMMNVIIEAALPITYSDILEIPQIVIHSVLASRILFNLRESDQRVHDGSLPVTMSSFHCEVGPGVDSVT